MKQTPRRKDSGTRGEACRIQGRGIPVRAVAAGLDYEATLQEEKRVLVGISAVVRLTVHCC